MFLKTRSFITLLLIASASLLSSCGSRKPATTVAAPAAAAPVATSPAAPGQPEVVPAAARYECPMRCAGSQSSAPGKCPVCDMALEKTT